MCLLGLYVHIKVYQKCLSFSSRGATLLQTGLGRFYAACYLPRKQKREKGRAVDYFGNGVFWPLGTALHLPHSSWATSGNAVSLVVTLHLTGASSSLGSPAGGAPGDMQMPGTVSQTPLDYSPHPLDVAGMFTLQVQVFHNKLQNKYMCYFEHTLVTLITDVRWATQMYANYRIRVHPFVPLNIILPKQEETWLYPPNKNSFSKGGCTLPKAGKRRSSSHCDSLIFLTRGIYTIKN